jgi:hypothetical protein
MAEVPQSWRAYAQFQNTFSSTNCITSAAALEEALNVVLEPDFRPESVDEADMQRLAESAARRDRHRAVLVRGVVATQLATASAAVLLESGEFEIDAGPRSLDDEVHARRQLAKLRSILREPDWDLLTGVAAGISYEELAAEHAVSAVALRSRVCRLRRAIE